ncbi:MAG: hypothetical protein GY841_15045 [FCB group bacterium]|nr:hypothetical protein [FCB group bacterium]
MQSFWDVFPIIIIFPTFAMALKWYLDYRTRLKLIEKGLVDEKIKYLDFGGLGQYAPTSLKWGLVLVFVGVVIVGLRLIVDDVAGEIALGVMLIAAGLALLLYYGIAGMARKKIIEERHQRSSEPNSGN